MCAAKRIASFSLLLLVLVCETAVGQSDRPSMTSASRRAVSGAVSIRLSNISDSLSFPPAKGANRILSANIKGGAVRSVWLAIDATSSARVPLTKVDEGEFQVNVYGQEVFGLHQNQRPDGEFHVFAETVDGLIAQSVAVRYTVRGLPNSLDFSWDRATVTIYQRCAKQLPGSHGNVQLRIGDITAGQVLVSVIGSNQDALVDMTSLRQGDTVRLPLADEEYVLVLDRLVNLLLGRDYAIFSLVSADAWQRDEIERILITIEKSEHTFIRMDQELTGEVFGGLLRQKLNYANPPVLSVDQFINQIASRSWTSGDAYQIRLSNGETVDASAWLRERADGEEENSKDDHAVPEGDGDPAQE